MLRGLLRRFAKRKGLFIPKFFSIVPETQNKEDIYKVQKFCVKRDEIDENKQNAPCRIYNDSRICL